MTEFYRALTELNSAYENCGCTVLTGEHAGEHCIVSNGRIRMSDSTFFEDRAEELMSLSFHGIGMLGNEKVFTETFGKQKRIVICGCGHVGLNVLKLSKMTGFKTVVVDDRPSFCDEARRSGADEVFCASYASLLSQIGGGPETFFVVMTRGHRYDLECLEEIMKKKYAYVGMMGSRGRTTEIKKLLLDRGISTMAIESLHAPIGLSIHAETPEEISISVMAEIILSLHESDGKTEGFPAEILSAVKKKCTKAIALVTERKGSAPRRAGTRMVIFEDGSTAGTVGGGCIESDVIHHALFLMNEGKRNFETLSERMSVADDGEEAMACGGNIDIFLEVLRE